MESSSFFERVNHWMRRSVTLRVLSIAFWVLLLLIPTDMVRSLIQERTYRRDAAIEEVSSKWSRAQTLSGPVLVLPYDRYVVDAEGRSRQVLTYAYFLPDSLWIGGVLTPEIRYRGLYQVPLYRSNLQVRGHFGALPIELLSLSADQIHWEDASLMVGLSDLRGIEEAVQVRWNQALRPFDPGLKTSDVLSVGIRAQVPINQEGLRHDFAFDLQLNGSESLFFSPLGRITQVEIASPWPSPSFDGDFLPDERNVGPEGFSATWQVLHLNRNFPQQWIGDQASPNTADFGLRLLISVDEYQRSTRAAKYALMIISLTFLVFFFVEIRHTQRIHPIQYLLVGLSLVMFYVLLLALSEQIGFNRGYLLSAGAVILLITAYVAGVFKRPTLSLLVAGLLTLLYGFVYVLLQLEDYALLIGSLGLFAVLALVMWLSRRVNWYAFSEEG
jgi:inner membrane protein